MPYITLEELYNVHAKSVYWAAYGVLHDQYAAADAMQNVFLNAVRNMGLLENMQAPQRNAWLHRCAVNASIDLLRRNKRTTSIENAGVTLEDDAKGPEELYLQSEQSKTVHKALQTLEKKYREPLYLYYFAQMDYKEISNILKINEGTLKSRMSRGRERMKKALKEGGAANAE